MRLCCDLGLRLCCDLGLRLCCGLGMRLGGSLTMLYSLGIRLGYGTRLGGVARDEASCS